MGTNDKRGGSAEPLAAALGRVLRRTGISDRLDQMSVLDRWPELVGPEIAAVTQPVSVSAAGVLLATAASHSWMHELGMLETDLLTAINRASPGRPFTSIRWIIKR